MRFITNIFALLFTVVCIAQETTGSIAGKLTDKEFNNEPLPFANVLIKGTTTGTTSDVDGLYEIKDLAPGSYTVIFSFVGYETVEMPAEVIAGKVTTINVPMGASAASLDEIVIKTTARKESEAALLLDMKKATEIKQSIGAQELARKGKGDAAEAIAAISGVSKQEGSSNVYVRGLGDRYLNTTMNGLTLPSNDINKKNIDLDLFSTDIIENVSISKAYSSRFYGDFSAGNVDVTSKDYTGKGFIDFFVGSSVNATAVDKSFVKNEGTSYFGYYNRYDNNPFAVILSHGIDPESAASPININFGGAFGKSFDFENGSRLSLYGTGSFENGYEYRRGRNVNYTNVENKAFEDAEEFEYSTKTTAMVSANFKLNNTHSFKFNSLFINNSTDRVGYFGIDGGGRNRDAFLDTDQGFYQMNVQFNQNLIYVNQLLGRHRFEKWDIDWGFGYNNVKAHEPDRKRITLENYQFFLDNDPNTNANFFNNVVYDNQRYFQDIHDEEYNSRINTAFDASETVKLNFGFNGRLKERRFENIRYGYDLTNPNTPVADVNDFNSIFSLQNLNITPNTGGLYQIQVFNSIPGQSFVNRPGLPENSYNGELEVFAPYANAEIKSKDEKWLIVPGVRAEFIDQSISYDVINLGSLGVNSVSASETVFLPSLSLRYALNDDMNLRASASQTISLPEFKEVAPFVYEGVSQRLGGNPDLLGRTANVSYTNVEDVSYSEIINLDLKYEWFVSPNELISLGGFYKRISNPVNQVIAFDATGTQRYFRTGEKAQVFGIEAEIRKNILMHDDDKTKLAAGFNATYMHTQQDLYDVIIGTYNVSFENDEEELQGASPWIINADISYSPKIGNFEPQANLVFSYFADRIDALGSGQTGNVIEKGIPTLDFILRGKISEKLDFSFGVSNILNPTIQYFREATIGDVLVTSANGKDVTDYKRGVTSGFSLKYKF